ncbi:MAG: YggT family protein, partial [SAR324 cluster bacterium]|nr:YggT family protein [SAR324 cluster bacterium]
MPDLLELIASGACLGLFVYKWIIIIAVVLTWVSADPYNPFVSWINRVTRPFWYWCERWLPLTMRHFSAYFSLLLVIFGQALIPASVRSINLFLQGMIEVDALALQFGGHLIQSTSIIAQSVFFFFMLILGFWFFLTLINPAYNNPASAYDAWLNAGGSFGGGGGSPSLTPTSSGPDVVYGAGNSQAV